MVKNHTLTKLCSDIHIHTIIYRRKKYCTGRNSTSMTFALCCMGSYMFAVTFCHFTFERNRGVRSMIFYDGLVIPECDSRHSLSVYCLPYPNLIRHHTIGMFLLCSYLFCLCWYLAYIIFVCIASRLLYVSTYSTACQNSIQK